MDQPNSLACMYYTLLEQSMVWLVEPADEAQRFVLRKFTKTVLLLFGAMVTGYLVVVVPGLILKPELLSSPFLKATWRAFDHTPFLAVVTGLFLTGVVFGAMLGRLEGLVGCATMTAFPIILLVDVVLISMNRSDLAGASHNLLPFSLISFGVMSVPGLAGAIAGGYLRKRFSSGGETEEAALD